MDLFQQPVGGKGMIPDIERNLDELDRKLAQLRVYL